MGISLTVQLSIFGTHGIYTSSYKNKRGDVYTTEDGHKYTLSKDHESIRYLKCILFREKCPSTAKLNKLTNIITISCQHNHPIDDYHAEKYKLKAKCKMEAKNSTTGVFNNTTRGEQSAEDISFKSCESIMYRAVVKLSLFFSHSINI